jgi:hypothetical protein
LFRDRGLQHRIAVNPCVRWAEACRHNTCQAAAQHKRVTQVYPPCKVEDVTVGVRFVPPACAQTSGAIILVLLPGPHRLHAQQLQKHDPRTMPIWNLLYVTWCNKFTSCDGGCELTLDSCQISHSCIRYVQTLMPSECFHQGSPSLDGIRRSDEMQMFLDLLVIKNNHTFATKTRSVLDPGHQPKTCA